MWRPRTTLAAWSAAAAAAAALAAGASGAPGAAPSCTVLAAKAGILSSELPRRIKRDAAGRHGAGIDRLICRDFTLDRRRDMVVSVFSGGRGGVEAWVFFRAVAGRWKLTFRRLHLYRASIRASGSAIVETTPDADGGYDHHSFRWKKGRITKIRTWHTAQP